MKNHQPRWASVFILVLFSVGLLAFPMSSALGQSTDEPKPKTEAELLKERLQQLEKTVSELKEQLNAMEVAKTKIPPQLQQATMVEATYKPAVVAPARPATPVNMLPDDTSAKPRPDATKGQTSQGESTFEVYGFAMLDAGYQFKANHPDWFDTLRVTKLPAFQDEFLPEGNTYWGVRQSRLGVKSSTPTKYGEFKTIFEFELFGTGVDAGQTTFRLRHAYGELGQVGAGQYWTVFGDTDTFPNSFEYWGPPGLIWFRNVGVRWMPLKGKNSITIGLERPGASADQGNYADRIELEGIRPKFNMPDIMGNFRMQRDWGHVQFAGILRKISWEDTNDDDIDLSDTVWGYGTSITSALNFGKNDVGRFSFVYGTGIQNYFNDAPVDVGVEVLCEVNPNTEGSSGNACIRGKTLPILGLSAFLDHRWNKSFTSALGWSMIDIDNSNGQAPNAFRQGHYALGNLAWYPVDNVMIGGEFQWGRRSNFLDGFSSSDYRIQFAFKYNFSKMLKL